MTNLVLDLANNYHGLTTEKQSASLNPDPRLLPTAGAMAERTTWQQPFDAQGSLTQKEPPAARDPYFIPHISIHVFCDSQEVECLVRAAAADRMMFRTNLNCHFGGIAAAIAMYQRAPSPNLIIIENQLANHVFLAHLDQLAELCSTNTKVMVIGHVNDVASYRELTKRGVSEYVPMPVSPTSLIGLISTIYTDAGLRKVGKVYGFIGARGGVGSSIIAQNVGWMIARQLRSKVVLADMDLAFGTASLNLDIEDVAGVAEAIRDLSRLDEVLFDRLLTKHGDYFNLLAAPGTLEPPYNIDSKAISSLLDVARASVPFIVLDLPHIWAEWTANTLANVDDIVITATPDLTSLRNTKGLVSYLRRTRPHDPPPKLVLNKIGVPKRQEVDVGEFSKAVNAEIIASISFDARLFGKAESDGLMLAQIAEKASASKACAKIVAALTNKAATRVAKSKFSLGAMLRGLRPN